MNNTDNTHLLIERMCAKVNDGRTITADDVAEMLDTIRAWRDLSDARVAAAYEAAAKNSYHNPDKEPDYPYNKRGELKPAYRDEFGDVKDPDGFAGQIALHDAWQASQDIRALTPADARTALDRMIAEAVAKEREACAQVAETEGVGPETNVYAGGPEWLKHGQRIAAAIRARGGREDG